MKKIILVVLFFSCCKEEDCQPWFLGGQYRCVSGTLFPVGKDVLFKSHYLYWNDVGYPYRICGNQLTFDSGEILGFVVERYAWGITLERNDSLAIFARR